MFYEWNGYKLRLDGMRIVALENALGGRSPLSVFANSGDGSVPLLRDIILILHYALQPMNSGIKMEDTYEIYDKWISKENVMTDLYTAIIEVFKISGLIPKGTDSKN